MCYEPVTPSLAVFPFPVLQPYHPHIVQPVYQYGPRAASPCQSLFVGVGSQVAYGAGGAYSCDIYYSDVPGSTTLVPQYNGYSLTLRQWHHVAWTYTGLTNTPVNVWSLYVDGKISTVVPSRVLNILRNPTGHIIGAFKSTAGAYTVGNFAISKLRIHDGCLTAAEVAYNFAQEAPLFIPSPSMTASTTPSPSSTQVDSFSATPSTSISSSQTATRSRTPSGTPCPPTFFWSHILDTGSFQLASDSTAFLRHTSQCGWVFGTANYPLTVSINAQEATWVTRLGLDGVPDSLSFQSVNQQGEIAIHYNRFVINQLCLFLVYFSLAYLDFRAPLSLVQPTICKLAPMAT